MTDRLREALREEVQAALLEALGGSVPVAADTMEPRGLTPREAQIIGALEAGAETIPEVAEDTGIPLTTAQQYLARLGREGLVRRLERGRYGVAE